MCFFYWNLENFFFKFIAKFYKTSNNIQKINGLSQGSGNIVVFLVDWSSFTLSLNVKSNCIFIIYSTTLPVLNFG